LEPTRSFKARTQANQNPFQTALLAAFFFGGIFFSLSMYNFFAPSPHPYATTAPSPPPYFLAQNAAAAAAAAQHTASGNYQVPFSPSNIQSPFSPYFNFRSISDTELASQAASAPAAEAADPTAAAAAAAAEAASKTSKRKTKKRAR
jgi:hypothetical protein